MIDAFDPQDPVHEIETLIRAAGNYVQPSEDLRPRVMEAVRTQRVERNAQRRIAQAAVLFIVLNFFATSTLQQVELADGSLPVIDRPSEPADTPAYRDSENWDTVESFRELRRRQATLLRLHL